MNVEYIRWYSHGEFCGCHEDGMSVLIDLADGDVEYVAARFYKYYQGRKPTYVFEDRFGNEIPKADIVGICKLPMGYNSKKEDL